MNVMNCSIYQGDIIRTESNNLHLLCELDSISKLSVKLSSVLRGY